MAFAFTAAIASFWAQSQPPTTHDESAIVIQGHLESKRAATDYIDKVLPPSFDGQLGRFEEPICAGTVGLPDKLQAEVLARIRRVATAAALPLGGNGCRPNLLIIVVDD